MYGRSVASSEQPPPRVREQILVQRRPPLIAHDLGELLRRGIDREIEQSETGAVRDHHLVVLLDSVLLRKDQLAQSVLATYPVAKLAQRLARARLRLRRHLRHRFDE